MAAKNKKKLTNPEKFVKLLDVLDIDISSFESSLPILQGECLSDLYDNWLEEKLRSSEYYLIQGKYFSKFALDEILKQIMRKIRENNIKNEKQYICTAFRYNIFKAV